MIMKLYIGPESGNSYKVRVLLTLLSVPHETVFVDMYAEEHKSAGYMNRINPRGQVPALEDDGKVFWDSSACMVYVARKLGREDWLPVAAAELAEVMQWLAMAASEMQFGLQYTRRGVLRHHWIAGDLDQLQAIGRVALNALEWRLSRHDWLVLDRPTIADIACFPYAFQAEDAKFSLADYPGISRWLKRCLALPKWPPMPPQPKLGPDGRPLS